MVASLPDKSVPYPNGNLSGFPFLVLGFVTLSSLFWVKFPGTEGHFFFPLKQLFCSDEFS